MKLSVTYNSDVIINFCISQPQETHNQPGINLRMIAEIHESGEVSTDSNGHYEHRSRPPQRVELDFRLPTHKYLDYMLKLSSTNEWMKRSQTAVRGPGPIRNQPDKPLLYPWWITVLHGSSEIQAFLSKMMMIQENSTMTLR